MMNISRKLTVGENYVLTLTIAIESFHKYGRVSQAVSSRLDYNSISSDKKQLRRKLVEIWNSNRGFCNISEARFRGFS